MKPAPSFAPERARSDYPLSGAKTGPAWRAIWVMLYQRKPDLYTDQADIVQDVHTLTASTGVSPRTIRNLLIAAEKVGILEKITKLSGGRNRAHYRIAKGHR